MTLRQCRWSLAGVIAFSIGSVVVGQESQPAAKISTEEPAYFDLLRSKDRLTQQIAQRYFNLVKLQEWTSANGKKVNAKYVSHDPDLKWVKLAVRSSSGDRSAKAVSVDLSRLNKTCQSRVKQIATLQKKLEELAAAETATEEAGQAGPGGIPESDRGAPMVDERGIEPGARGPEEAYSAPGERGATSEGPPSQSETLTAVSDDPDPLGFAEIPASAAPAVAGPSVFMPAGPDPGAIRAEESADPSDWATNYDAFHANFTVTADESGEARVDFGQLKELSEMSKLAEKRPNRAPGRLPDAPVVAVQWEATFQGIRETPDTAPIIEMDLRQLPPPLQLQIRIDDQKGGAGAQDWATFVPGDRVRFKGLLDMESPTLIVLYVREPEKVDAQAGGPPSQVERR
jgi:hypothetical protein